MANNDLLKKGAAVCDDTFVLKVTKDRLKAYISPIEEKEDNDGGNEEGGGDDKKKLDIKALLGEVKALGVITGLVKKPIPEGDGIFVVAKGRPAINGENSKFKPYVKPSIVRTPKTKGGGKVDYRELGSIVNVPKDKLLIEKIPATPGTKGENVFGEAIKPKPGKELTMKVGTGVSISEDGLKAVSTVDGKFMLIDGKASVMTDHKVSGNTDLSEGNIAFVGKTLEINGTVQPGFKVKCKGDIYIAKGVENSAVVAGGNLEVRGGVIGEDVVLQAWGDIKTDFVENVGKIETGGSLTITDSIIQASVKVGKDIKILNGKGTLIGGDYIVGGSIYAKELGSDAEVVTKLNVGMNPLLEDKKRQLDEDKALWPARMSENLKNTTTLKKMKKEEGTNFSPEKLVQLEKLVADLPTIMEKVNEITLREEEMEEEMAKSINECIHVYGTAFPGVTVTIGPATKVLIDEDSFIVIHFDKPSQSIKIRPMSVKEKSAV